MYVRGNPKSKAQIKRDLKAGIKLTVFAPGLDSVPSNGVVYLEGPHYPHAHTWYGQGTMKNNLLVAIK